MKLITNAPYLIGGQIENHAFTAAVYPEQRIILIYSVDKSKALPNNGTESRILYVASRLALLHRLSFWLKLWRIIEIQTCFGDTRAAEITGISRREGLWANYHTLACNELLLVPILVSKA